MLYESQNEAGYLPVQLNFNIVHGHIGWETAAQICDHFFLCAEK